MIEVVNRQRKVAVDLERWQTFAAKALKAVPANGAGATVAFVSDRQMRWLNRRWRGKRGTTDVLSFPNEPEAWEQGEGRTQGKDEGRAAGPDEGHNLHEGRSLGDVVISLEQAARQARENGLTLEEEIAQLILHGLLHLCGYDHESDGGEMNALELRLRRRLGI